MHRTIYEMNYRRMEILGIIKDGKVTSEKRVNGSYMPLSIDNLGDNRIALAHNYIQNGDVMADPDMEIRIYPEKKMVEALTYQQDGLGIFQRVYPSEGMVCPQLKVQLNRFLGQWLRNLEQQGFGKVGGLKDD